MLYCSNLKDFELIFSLIPLISLANAFVGGGSYPSHIYEDKYLAMKRNKEEIYALPNKAKENFVLFTDEDNNQVKIQIQ